jgi:hypothetical protein
MEAKEFRGGRPSSGVTPIPLANHLSHEHAVPIDEDHLRDHPDLIIVNDFLFENKEDG